MSSLKVDIVTAERTVYSGEVEAIIAPGVEGQLGILPHHAPLMTILQAGELVVRKGGRDESLAISGGFLEVRPDRVIILADSAERAEEIDVARAEAAKKRAEERMVKPTVDMDFERARVALLKALIRLQVATRARIRS